MDWIQTQINSLLDSESMLNFNKINIYFTCTCFVIFTNTVHVFVFSSEAFLALMVIPRLACLLPVTVSG